MAAKAFARYELVECVGSGHFGNVWRAFDTKLQRQVALKIPKFIGSEAKDRSQFFHEARAAARLNHRGIVTVHEVGEEENCVYIVSEFVGGGTLQTILREEPLSISDVVNYALQILSALGHAHENQIIHRDLKPANILIGDQRQLKIADFGLAKQYSVEGSSGVEQTKEGQVFGTMVYMSPEQARGAHSLLDQRSDLYAFGVIFYEMLTRNRPFRSGDPDFATKLQFELPIPPRQLNSLLPDVLSDICMKCLAKSPDDRYANAGQIEADLQSWLSSSSSSEETDEFDIVPLRGLAAPPKAQEAAPSPPTPASTSSGGWLGGGKLGRRAVLGLGLTSAAVALAATTGNPFKYLPKPGNVRVTTNPPGARVVFWGFHPQYGILDPEQRYEARGVTPTTIDLPPGDYFVVAALNDEIFHEVIRRVPKNPQGLPPGIRHQQYRYVDGVVNLAEIDLFGSEATEGMALSPAEPEFQMGIGNEGYFAHRRRIPSFYIESTETTYRKLAERFPNLRGIRSYVVFNQRPEDRPTDFDLPAEQIWWDDALWMAELMGKRLMFESEYECVATNRGTTVFPWGDDPTPAKKWLVGSVGVADFDVVQVGNTRVQGLFSNAAEWTMTPACIYPRADGKEIGLDVDSADFFVIRGGDKPLMESGEPSERLLQLGSRSRDKAHRNTMIGGLGFRCARSHRPRLTVEDIEEIIRK
jgi:serine/threonine protein kinase/formylglycine-generating enzyme required for sulfatase activity